MMNSTATLMAFYVLASLAICIQVLNVWLMNREPSTKWYPGIPWYKQENNFYYFLRNSLITAANLTLQAYSVVFTLRLCNQLSKRDETSFQRVKVRIVLLCVIIEVFLLA